MRRSVFPASPKSTLSCDMKNYTDLGGCLISAEADSTLHDLHNSSYHTQPFKLIDRIVATNSELYIYGIECNDNCYYCGNPDSIIHTFVECHFSETFFNQVLDYFNRVNGVALKPLESGWLFGLPPINEHHTTILIKKLAISYYLKNATCILKN